jgi:hypothetical protein
MNSVLVLVSSFGMMVGLAGMLTLLNRWCGGARPPARRRRRFRRRAAARVASVRDGARSRKVVRVRRASAPNTRRRPVEQVAADLRRLARELAAVPAGAPYVRWQALQNAYDRVLVEAAELLEVPHELAEVPVAGTAHDIERLRVVCALEAAGLVMEG